jgi:hypothetical protein
MASSAMTIVQVKGRVEWKARRARGGNWVAICDPLKLTLQAQTWADLMEDIAFTLNAMLKDLLVSNELPLFMKEHGWKLAQAIPDREANVRFDLPYEVMSSHGSQRALCQ